ncbi:MAG: ABC transporter permease [Chloroflexota bacterium]
MTDLGAGLAAAWRLISTFDREFYGIVGMSLAVSLAAVTLAALVGVPAGALLGLRRFRGRTLLTRLAYTLSGLPPVVAGLLIYLLLSRSGPFGFLSLLFTPWAMIIAQFALALPIVISLTAAALRVTASAVRETAISLGATPSQADLACLREAVPGLLAAVMTAYGRVAAEVGAVMMVGGNIRGETRVMTTAIVLETRQGHFDIALGLGLVLLTLSFVVNSLLHRLQVAQGKGVD